MSRLTPPTKICFKLICLTKRPRVTPEPKKLFSTACRMVMAVVVLRSCEQQSPRFARTSSSSHQYGSHQKRASNKTIWFVGRRSPLECVRSGKAQWVSCPLGIPQNKTHRYIIVHQPSIRKKLFVESPCLGQRKNQSNSRMLAVMAAMARAETQGTSPSIALVVVLNKKQYSHANRDTNFATPHM